MVVKKKQYVFVLLRTLYVEFSYPISKSLDNTISISFNHDCKSLLNKYFTCDLTDRKILICLDENIFLKNVLQLCCTFEYIPTLTLAFLLQHTTKTSFRSPSWHQRHDYVWNGQMFIVRQNACLRDLCNEHQNQFLS